MSDFVTVARTREIAPGQSKLVTVNGRMVGLFNVGGVFHAIDNICLHRGGPLAGGTIGGQVVTCPWHGWQYDVTTGHLVQDPTVGVTRHDTRVVDDEVQVRLTD